MLEVNLETARMILDIKKKCIKTGSCGECTFRETCEDIDVPQETIKILEWLINKTEMAYSPLSRKKGLNNGKGKRNV